jgi:GTP-binding protein HflX
MEKAGNRHHPEKRGSPFSFERVGSGTQGLLANLEVSVAEELIVTLREPSPRYLVGDGKADEITRKAVDAEADFIVFDDDLSPSQQRNWENLTGLCVIDRQEVILEIFADRAQTKEAVLQVGLARLEYSLPRLTRAWSHLSRQRGGRKGTKGEGETQLEIDRRIVERKISRFRKELKAVKASRAPNGSRGPVFPCRRARSSDTRTRESPRS